MENLPNLVHVLLFTKDGGRLHLDCFRSLQKMMSEFTGSAEEIESLSQLADFMLVLIEQEELSKPEGSGHVCQLQKVKASGDKQPQNIETIKSELFHLSFEFVSSNACNLTNQNQNAHSHQPNKMLNSLHKILLKCCFYTGDENRHAKYLNYLLSLFSRAQTESIQDKVFLPAIDYVCQYLDQSSNVISLAEQNSILKALGCALQAFQEQILAEIFLNLIPKLWSKSPDRIQLLTSLLGSCFERSLIKGDEVSAKDSGSRSLFLVCGLSGIFFESGLAQETRKLLEHAQLCLIVKFGLTSPDALGRKRGLFLLRKLLDCSERAGSESAEAVRRHGNAGPRTALRKFWEDFVLVLETLEETQFHLIDPVLKKVDSLIETALVDSSEAPPTCLSPSCDWLLIIFKRMMDHDCSLVKRYGLSKFLRCVGVDVGNQALVTEFFCNHVLDSLQDSSVYYRSTNEEKLQDSQNPSEEEQSTNDVAEALIQSFKSVDLEGEGLRTFILSLLVGISSRSWNGPILCTLLKSIDVMRQEQFLAVADVLPIMRTIFSKTLVAFDSKIKAIARHYLTILVTHFVDPNSVNPEDLLSLASIIPCCVEFTKWKNLVEWTSRCLRVERSEFESSLYCTFKRRQEELLKSPCLSLDERFTFDEFTSETECSAIVRAILLVDKALEFKFIGQGSSPIRNKINSAILQPMEDILRQLIGHAYLSENKVHWVMMMLLTFARYLKGDQQQLKKGCDLHGKVVALLHDFSDSMVVFTARRFAQTTFSNYSSMRLYVEMIGTCCRFHGNDSLHYLTSFQQLFDWSIGNLGQLSSTNKMSKMHLSSLELLSMAVETLPRSMGPLQMALYERPLMDLMTSGWDFGSQVLESFELSFVNPKKMHVVRDHMMGSKLTLLGWLFESKKSSSLSSSLLAKVVEFVESCIECGSVDCCKKCCRVLGLLLPELNRSKAGELIATTWKRITDLSKKSRFLECFQSFVSSAFDLRLTGDADDGDPFDEGQQFLVSTVVGIAHDILSMSEDRPQLLNIVIKTVCDQVAGDGDLVGGLVPLVPFVARALVFGPLQDRASRFRDNLVEQYDRDWSECGSNSSAEEHLARVTLLRMLLGLRPIGREQSLFGFSLLDELLANYRETLARSSRCYGNSMLHRCKHRMMVAMFAMEAFLMVKKGQVIRFLLEVPSVENQPSVRFLASWMIIRIVGVVESKYFQSLLRLIEESDGDKMKKPSLLTSMFHVISHVVARSMRTCGTQQQQLSNIQKYLDVLLTWSTMPQSSTRISSQASVLFLAERVRLSDGASFERKKADEPTSPSYASLFNLHNFLVKNRSTYRHAFQLLDSIYYRFDPFLDATMEAVTHFVPLLTGLSPDECLDVRCFDPKVEGSIPTSLSDERRSVWERCLLPGNIWKDSSANNNTSNSNNNNNNPTNSNNNSSNCNNNHDITNNIISLSSSMSMVSLSDNVQRKLVPWKDLLLTNGRSEVSLGGVSVGNDRDGGLILVASLVDRIPNLGGLCRTCEIFGVSKMVVSSSKVVSDVNFEKLSVTAHKWVDIEEVPVRGLPSYLSSLTREGYTLVALEQTSQSIPLQRYKFPKKCAVILGNERSGIPVEVIQLMGVCLEIPQHGVIRSLNVHVSGALLMWEYFKQTNLGSAADESYLV